MIDYGSYKNEYLQTNNLGSYSSSNYLYGNTRKYHSLLASSRRQIVKYNVLNRIIDQVITPVSQYSLSTQIYENHLVQPDGYRNISNFNLSPQPTWTFKVPSVEIQRTQILLQNEDTLMIKYEMNSSVEGSLIIKPMVNFRSIHEVNSKNNLAEIELTNINHLTQIKLDNLNSLFIFSENGKFVQNPDTYYKLYYPDEEIRGYESFEDLYVPGYLESKFVEGKSVYYYKYSLEYKNNPDLASIWQNEVGSKSQASSKDIDNQFVINQGLKNQAEQFIVKTNNSAGINAGYHWFDEWARDTFISLKGLCLVNSDYNTAKLILAKWGSKLKDGLLPNRIIFDNYRNSIDGMLWLAVRLYDYTEFSGDNLFAEKLLPKLEDIYISAKKGKNSLHITEQGFLYDDLSKDARTWMDAKIDNKPVIDRSGLAVEIQALWYNFVRILINFKEKYNDRTNLKPLKDIKILIEKNFVLKFWNNAANCLYDSIREKEKDKSIRPNQVIALYLPFKILNKKQSKIILATIEQKLVTEVGLKTLPLEDPNYHETYYGNQESRDQAYHQGTIWPFLLGFYLCAYLDVYSGTKNSIKYVENQLDKFNQFFENQHLKYIPEVFSPADLSPNGCLSQAWNVALFSETQYHLDNIKKNNVH